MFNIPIFGGIPVGESVVVTWIIMAALTILSIILVRNLKVENPGRKQLALEASIGFLNRHSGGGRKAVHTVSDFYGALYRGSQFNRTFRL